MISDLRLNPHLRRTSLLIISHLGNEYSSLEREKAIDYLTVDNEEFILETKGKEETDESGNMVELAKNIVVNHWGTILSSRRLKLNEDGYIKIIEGKDLVDTNEGNITLQKFLNNSKYKCRNYLL